MYAITIFINENLCFVTQVQLFLMTVTVNLMLYIALTYYYWVSFQDSYQWVGLAH